MRRATTSLAIGKPIRISELPTPPPRGHDWETVLKGIPLGYAQRVSVHASTVKNAIERLESSGTIPKGEYVARTRKQGNKQSVYVLHQEGIGTAPRTIDEEVVGAMRDLALKFTQENVEKSIMNKKDLEHTLAEVQTNLLGRTLSSRGADTSNYHRTKRILKKAQEHIEQLFDGKFISTPHNGVKVYRFQKNQS